MGLLSGMDGNESPDEFVDCKWKGACCGQGTWESRIPYVGTILIDCVACCGYQEQTTNPKSLNTENDQEKLLYFQIYCLDKLCLPCSTVSACRTTFVGTFTSSITSTISYSAVKMQKSINIWDPVWEKSLGSGIFLSLRNHREWPQRIRVLRRSQKRVELYPSA